MAPENCCSCSSDEEDRVTEFSSSAIGTWRYSAGWQTQVRPSDSWQREAVSGTQPSLTQVQRHTDRVPKTVDLAAEFAKVGHGCSTTTLMIRNIPSRLSQKALIEELEYLGFGGTFDFVYVPLDLKTVSNVGYAFVNFVSPSYAGVCTQLLNGRRLRRQSRTAKLIQVSVAHIQGLNANLKHYEKTAVANSRLRQRRPVILQPLLQHDK